MKVSEKETAIYTAVFHLAKSGRELRSLKVQEIADAAGIGKGTLYEYFGSKEEIIEGTLRYFMDQEIGKFLEILNQPLGFEEILHQALSEMLRSKECYSSFQVLFTNSDRLGPGSFLAQNKETISILIPIVSELVNQLIDKGIKEGVVDGTLDREYQHMIIIGAIGAFNLTCKARRLFDDSLSFKKAEDDAVTMIMDGLRVRKAGL